MKSFDFDAFGNPLEPTANGQSRAVFVYRDGQLDPALAFAYHQPRHHTPTPDGRFISLESCEGEATDPASLQRFAYAGLAPVCDVDPALT
jgi:hypothetical protein